MKETELQRRPLFGIGTVSRLTGIKADTLRVWERRYQLGASCKTSSGRRLFSQSDLEHLQLVAALVDAGIRIGDIARAERRTLEVLLTARGVSDQDVVEAKPKVLFLGAGLCDWVDQHQGLMTGVDAFLLAADPLEFSSQDLGEIEEVHCLVVEAGGLGNAMVDKIIGMGEALNVANILVTHRFANQRWLQALARQGVAACPHPPEPDFIVSYFKTVMIMEEVSPGSMSIGELAQVKPRLYDEETLSSILKQPNALACECQRHIVELVRTLAEFENYSANCSVETWQDAAVHACLYAYAGQSRWLMEKALAVLVDAHELPVSGERGVDEIRRREG